MSLAESIRSARLAKNWTLKFLAQQAGISKTYLWQLEMDKDGLKKPSADVVVRIASALGISFADLMALKFPQVPEVWFAYDEDQKFRTFPTEAEARDAAAEALACWRDVAMEEGEWPEDSGMVMWGRLHGRAVRVDSGDLGDYEMVPYPGCKQGEKP